MEHLLALEDVHLAPVWADGSGGGGGASTQALSPVLWSTHGTVQPSRRYGKVKFAVKPKEGDCFFLLVVRMHFS